MGNFGYTTIGTDYPNYQSLLGGFFECKFTLNSTQTFTSISIYLNQPYTDGTFYMYITDENYVVVGYTSEGSLVTGAGWQTLNLTSSIELNAGIYYIGFMSTVIPYIYYDDGAVNQQSYWNGFSYTYPPTTTIPVGASNNFVFSIYATYTDAPPALPFSSGWENSGGTDVTDNGIWNTIFSTPSVVTSPKKTGSYAMHVDVAQGGGGGVGITIDEPIIEEIMNIYIESGLPATNSNQLFGDIRNTNSQNQVSAMIWNDQDVNFYWGLYIVINNTVISVLEPTPSQPTTGVWYEVKMLRDVTGSTTKLWIDGVLKIDRSGLDAHIGNATLVYADIDWANGGAMVVDFDDIYISSPDLVIYNYIKTITEYLAANKNEI